MSAAVFPALLGLGWSVKRSEIWVTRSQESVSGKEVRIADWTFPRHEWELTFEHLLQGSLNGQTRADFASLSGFFNLRQGMFDSWLYQDVDDNAVTDQIIAVGDGTTTAFQLIRSFGNFVEPMLAPNVITNVKVANSVQSPGTYSVDSTTGILTFNAAPANAAGITATFSYFFRCRFLEDRMDFEKFSSALYLAKSVKFQSLKET